MISLTRAAQDPALLGGSIDLWPRQLQLLRELEGPERTHVVAAARQVGKSTLTAMLAIHNAALRPDLDAVLPRRRRRYILVAAPSEDGSREFIDIAAGLIEDSPMLRSIAEVSSNRIDFNLRDGRRSCIQAMPANAKTVRGRSASLVIFDEHGHFDLTAGPGSDQRLYLALRPSMRRFGELARVVCISTPGGEHGKFFELYRDAQTGVLPSARAVQLAAWEVDPSYGEEQRAADRAELGEDGFAEEVGAQFVSGRGSFFDLAGIRFDSRPASPAEGTGWIAGLDSSFSSDLFGVCVVGRSVADKGMLVVGAVAALKPNRGHKASQDSFESERRRQDEMMERVWEIIEPYSPRGVADLHKGGPVKSYLGRLGCSVKLLTPTGTLQKQQFVALRARLEDGSLRAWSHPQLVQDLRRVRTTDGDKIVLPRVTGSGHCDAAVALSLAAWELKDGGEGRIAIPQGRVDVRAEGRLRAAAVGGMTDQPLRLPTTAFPPGTPEWQKKLTRKQFRR